MFSQNVEIRHFKEAMQGFWFCITCWFRLRYSKPISIHCIRSIILQWVCSSHDEVHQKSPFVWTLWLFHRCITNFDLFKCTFTVFCPLNNLQEVHLNLVNGSLVILTRDNCLNAINLLVHPSKNFFTPSITEITTSLYQMGYQKKLKGIGEFKKNQLPAVWQFVCHFVIRSLSGRTGGTDNMGLKLLELVCGIFTGHDVNVG